jgi:glycosyltransferase involved in cell wall biosynthesis
MAAVAPRHDASGHRVCRGTTFHLTAITTRPPRILTVVASLGVGGTERAAQNYSIALSRANLPSAVFAYRSGGPRADTLERAHVPTMVGSLTTALKWKPDVVHIHRPGLQDRWSGDIITAFAEQGSTIIETNVFGKPDYSKTAARIAVHLQLSEWGLWKWRRRTAGIRPRPTGIVFPYAVDSDAFKPLSDDDRAKARSSMGIPADAVLLGRVGQPIEAKWNVDIVEAFDNIARRNVNVYLALVGASPSVLRAIYRLDPQVRTRISLNEVLTSDEELRRFYSSLDCLLHSARIGESFGMVIMEALLCGTPVVTRIRLIRDNTQALLVNHRATGILTATTAGMVRALDEVIRDRAVYRRRVVAARADLVDRFSMESLRTPLCELVSSAAALDVESFRKWCTARFASEPDVSQMFRKAAAAYGYRPLSAHAAQLAHSAALYRLVAWAKHRKS